jgi:hydroxyacylglutathione hydrolase
MPLVRRTFPVGLFGCNCTIVACPETAEALVVDPGDEAPSILQALARDGLKAVTLVHTHAHFDHLMATGEVAAATGAGILLHREDRWLWDNAVMQTEMFGVARADGKPWAGPPGPTLELSGDEAIAFGRREAHVIHTPGHTPGSLCLLLQAAGETPLLLSGDTLFRRSIGRTDLWGGSTPTLLQSIRQRLLPLPDATRVIPGHGVETTIAEEREHNPFVGSSGRFAG